MTENRKNYFVAASIPSQALLRKEEDSQIKILHLISSHGLFGAENIVLNLSGAFNHHGMTSLVGAINNKTNPHLEIVERARELKYSTCVFECSGKMDFSAVWQLKNYLQKNQIDILHTHNYKSDTIGLLAAKWAGVPIVATAHGFTDIDRKVTFYENWDRWLLRRFFDKVVVVSENVVPKLSKHKKRVIANGLDIEKFNRLGTKRLEIRRKHGIKDNEIVIATVGRLSPEKNQALLLKAAEQLVQKFDHIKFLIVGGGPEEDHLRRMVAENKLADKIIFTGIIKDMPLIYQAMDIFVLTSLTEGIPLTILEAMAAHVPVVATKVGGVPELIKDQQTGLLVSSGDENDLVKKLEMLSTDHSLRHKLTQAAFDFVKNNYSTERMASAYGEVYREVLGGRR